MTEEKRPNPDEILRKIKETQPSDGKGRLKIFFGYAAGVGKTYAMLESAHTIQKAGVDVVVGYVEPHTRPETMAQLSGLEQLAPLKVNYKGVMLNEFDLDAALKRHPEVILVDELAHTNAQGCRHTKRYSDIEELLDAGINVYTTVNVQHLESLNDIVNSVTNVSVNERIPDFVFDEATQVELIDIEPDDLIDRLNQGKVYKGDRARTALNNFFSRENLISLREIALRRTAARVNKQVEINKAVSSNKEAFSGEHVLVCVSTSPANAKVIRAAARMAAAFDAHFTALFVETPKHAGMDQERRIRLSNNLKLAEQLGAKIATVYGEDIPFQISEYAKVSGISKIILGRTNGLQPRFTRKQNFTERLTALAPNVDIYIIPDQPSAGVLKRKRKSLKEFLTVGDVVKTLVILSICTVIGFVFYETGFSDTNMITVYILGVLIISSQVGSQVYGIVASICGVIFFNFFFTIPRFSLQAYDKEYIITFLVMLSASIITSTLTMKVRDQAKASAINAHRTEVLLETSQRLQRSADADEIVEKSAEQLFKLLNTPIMFYTVKDGELEQPRVFDGGENSDKYIKADEQAVATWAFRNKKPAGVTTDTLPGAKGFYLPVKSNDRVLAVIGIALEEAMQIEPFERSLLIAMVNEISFVMDKYYLNEIQKETTMQAEKERLRANLLRAISHDLRTPLTSISGNASILLSNRDSMEDEAQSQLLENIYDDSLWLINLVENLLAVTRIDNGSLSIKTQPELIEEILAEALLHVNRKQSEHNISVEVQDDLLMAKVDARMIIQVIINIVDNAIKYTEPGSNIVITAFRRAGKVIVEIADNGKGISAKDKAQIFDMYFTAESTSGDSRRGLGLGLALCQSIVNAMGGMIYVRDNKPCGTVFGFTLQLEEVKQDE